MVKICLLFVLTWLEFLIIIMVLENFDVVSLAKNGHFCHVLCYSAYM